MNTNITRIIEVTVSPTGETTVQTRGFTGSSCRDGSRFVERALGDAVAERKTAEFYATAPVIEQQVKS